MKKQFVLPYTLDVEVRMYQDKAFPLGVIKANIDNYDIWLCNKLFDCVYENGLFDIKDDDLWSIDAGMTCVQNIYVAPESLSFKGMNLIEFNKSMLNKRHYITGTFNEFYIPGKSAYFSYDFNHDYVIFGYDDMKKVFKSAAYLQNRSYSFVDIAYEDYINAVTKNKISKANVDYFLINPAFNPTINVERIISKLKAYIYPPRNNKNANSVAGIKVWEKLAEYVLSVEQRIDLRFGRAYMEYHGLTLKRIHILSEYGYINRAEFESGFQQIYSDAVRVHHLFIKYYLNPSRDLLIRISDLINNNLSEEKQWISLLISSLSK